MKGALLLCFTVFAVAQDQTGGIHGTVVDALTHAPIRNADVHAEYVGQPRMGPVTYGPSAPSSSLTDASGAFSLNSLAAGPYTITAAQPNYPQARQVHQKVEVKAGEIADAVTIELTPAGTIGGHVFDEDGDPLTGCSVQAHPATRLYNMMSNSGLDENGEYRLSRLAAGKYVVSAQCSATPFEARPFSSGPDPPPSRAYVTQYYESAIDAKSAQTIEVAPGAEKSGVDFQMHTGAVTQVHGKFSPGGVDWHGQPLSLMLNPVDPAAQFQGSPMRQDQDKGTFDFLRVFPGSYLIVAILNGNQENRAGGFARIEVQDKPVNVVITLSHGADVHGTVEIENNNNQQITLNQFNVQVMPERGMGFGNSMVNVSEDGTFTLKNVLPMRYRLMVNGPGAFVREARLGTTDVTHGLFDVGAGASEPLKIVMSTNTASITGTASVGQTVYVQSYDPDNNEPQNFFGIGADQTGHFTVNGLAPGKYRLMSGDNGTSPDEVTEKGQEVTVGEGDRVTLDLKPPSPAQ